MIIDAILDRKDAYKNGEVDVWTEEDVNYIREEAEYFGFDYILEAYDSGNETNVQEALCRYIDEEGYSPNIKHFVNAKFWVVD